MKTRCNSFPVVRAFASTLTLAAASTALATPQIENAFIARYPTSTLLSRTEALTGSSCFACHHSTTPYNSNGNCYRKALLNKIQAGMSNAAAINALDTLDSDLDGVPNGVEITMPRSDQPGQIGYNPGLVGNTGTDGCSSNPSAPITFQLETPPPVQCAADLDDGTGSGTPSGGVDINDLLYFLSAFSSGTPAADLDNGSATGTPDGGIDINDLLYFLAHFEAGC